ncbi:MAG: protein kinase domain-containing protein [Phycisphaerales bacterium]
MDPFESSPIFPASAQGIVEQPGDRIGPYELVAPIGRGGYGTVWKAIRREPFTQQVAIKIVKPGMDSEAVLARFAQERQTLARMEHPGIARVIDGGLTPRGRPYFVMELVEGAPITAWCDERRLSLRDRVALLAEACDAVQHAHAKGVIHRDLKPSNILVAEVDGRPRAKVIDFGISKALVGDAPGSTLTEVGQTLGTPEYMSPEQADPDGADIDTRSDVYGLGATLYELLCGRPPFGDGPGTTSHRAAVLKAVRQDLPARPSVRIARQDEAAARRNATASELAATLARDLDWVPMKALRKAPEARYAAASELAEDLRDWLDGRVIAAAPESVAYRTRMFVRRNRLAVASAAAIGASLIVATAVSTRYALAERDARIDADEARQAALAREAEANLAKADALAREAETRRLAEFQGEVLGALDAAWIGAAIRQDVTNRQAAAVRRIEPDRQAARDRVMAFFNDLMLVNRTDLGIEVLDRWILDPMSKGVEARFADLPLAAAALRHGLAESRWNIRQLDEARREIDLAVEARRAILGDAHLLTARSLATSSIIAASEGRLDRAVAEGREALESLRGTLGPDDDDTLRQQTFLAEFLIERGQAEQALPLLEDAVARTVRGFGPEDVRTGTRRSALASALIALDRLADAEPHAREGHRIRVATLGPDARYTIRAQTVLGDWFAAAGRGEEAAAIFTDAMNRSVKTDGSDHPATVLLRLRCGEQAIDQGDAARAAACFRDAFESSKRSLGVGHPSTIESAALLAWSLGADDPSAAEEILGEALAAAQEALGERHEATLRLVGVQAWLQRGHVEPTLEVVLAAAADALPSSHPTRRFLERLAGLGPPANPPLP